MIAMSFGWDTYVDTYVDLMSSERTLGWALGSEKQLRAFIVRSIEICLCPLQLRSHQCRLLVVPTLSKCICLC